MGTNATSVSLIDRLVVDIPEFCYQQISSYVDPKWATSSAVVLIAVITVWFGVTSTIARPKSASQADPASPLFHSSDFDHSKYTITTVAQAALGDMTLKWYQVAVMPVATSAVLVLLYYLMKAASETVNWVMNMTFLVYSPLAAIFTLESIIERSERQWPSLFRLQRYRVSFSKDMNSPLGWMDTEDKLDPQQVHETYPEYVTVWPASNQLESVPVANCIVDFKEIIVIPLALVFAYIYYVKNPVLSPGSQENWLVTNAVSFCCTVCGIMSVEVAKLSHLVALFVSLFAYDIYFVFRTPMMETVAKGLQVPIKFVVPQAGSSYFAQSFSLIGTGDLMLPGVFLGFLIRFDYYNYYKHNAVPFHHRRVVPRVFFRAGLLSYTAGLVMTMIAVHVFERGQPALLYIVPCMVIGTLVTAVVSGNWEDIWAFNDEIEMKTQDNEVTFLEGYFPDEEDQAYVYQPTDEDLDTDDDSVDGLLEERVELLVELSRSPQQWQKGESAYHPTERPLLPTPPVYQFVESSDEDDDTYIIGDDSESDDDAEDAFDEDLMGEISRIRNDLCGPPQKFYSDEE